MLIQKAIDFISSSITSLGWVGRYGGVVQMISFDVPIGIGKPTLAHRFPVSCGVSEADCNQDQFYLDLVPDDRKTSILYWEITQGLQDVGAIGGVMGIDSVRKLRGRARLVGWMNTMLMGLRECNTASKAIRTLLPVINTRVDKDSLVGSEFEHNYIQFRLIGEAVKDKDIFAKYDYGNTDRFLLYPFDYFAIDVSIETAVSTGCSYTLDLQTPIDCIDNSKL